METILSSLNALVEKLGGDTSDNKLIVDALNDISEQFGGDADSKMIVDALNNIVENYSGNAKYVERKITIVNNLANNVTFSSTNITNNKIHYSSGSVKSGATTVFNVVGYPLVTGKFSTQSFLFRCTNGAINSISVEGMTVTLSVAENGYYIATISSSPQDLTFTIS